jgi:hypothetical protein
MGEMVREAMKNYGLSWQFGLEWLVTVLFVERLDELL